jgi:hypothetical protein
MYTYIYIYMIRPHKVYLIKFTYLQHKREDIERL